MPEAGDSLFIKADRKVVVDYLDPGLVRSKINLRANGGTLVIELAE
jgi:hypothetical protein